MVTTIELVDATIRVKKTLASHIGWPLAAIRAIEGKGILHKPDVTRLKKAVIIELKKRGIATSPPRRRVRNAHH